MVSWAIENFQWLQRSTIWKCWQGVFLCRHGRWRWNESISRFSHLRANIHYFGGRSRPAATSDVLHCGEESDGAHRHGLREWRLESNGWGTMSFRNTFCIMKCWALRICIACFIRLQFGVWTLHLEQEILVTWRWGTIVSWKETSVSTSVIRHHFQIVWLL